MSAEMNDSVMHGLALIELVKRLGGAPVELLEEYEALAESLDVREAMRSALYLAGMVVSIAETTHFPLDAFIATERADKLYPGQRQLKPDEPPEDDPQD